MKHLSIITLSISILFLTGCKNEATPKSNETISNETPSIEQTTPKVEENLKEINLEISSNDQMQYDKTELKVKTGQKITLTLKHTGKMKKEVMGHNWVLLKIGTDIPIFAAKAVKAKDNEYIPSGDEIIAHTKIIGGGESDSITFDAPEKGIYDFICSFPGHYAIMKGKLIVE